MAHPPKRHASPALATPFMVPVVSGPKLRNKVPMVAGFLPAGLIIPDNYVIPHFDPRTKKGYQRLPQQARINELANDLRKDRVDLPTAVLLNLRDREAGSLLREGHLDLKAALLGSTKFYVVDGQHRILALEKLIGESEGWQDFPIPFVCMLGASEEEEMDQFYVVNSKAKSVRTDLAFELLKRRADANPEVLISLQEKNKDWQVTAQHLVEALAATPIWKDRIRFPAMEKGHTVMPSASMVMSLKPLLGSPYFKILSDEQRIEVLDAFWRGLRNLMIPAFDEPENFVLQKGLGVIVLHAILVHVLEIVRANGWSIVEPESYERVMGEALDQLQGDDGEGRPVSGIDFWRTAPVGAAGSYSSSAGRRVLIAKLEQALPDVVIV